MTSVSAFKKISDTVSAPQFLVEVPVRSVVIPSSHRKHQPDAISAMAENISLHGLLQPIEVVRSEADEHRLVFGSLRLQAIQLLGWTGVSAFVREADEFGSELALRLRSIFESLYRSQLTALDWAVAVSDWCDIYRAGQPPLKPGRKPANSNSELSLNFRLNSDDDQLLEASSHFAASFSEAAQAFLDISRAKVFRALRIASIPSLQRDRIALHRLARSEGDLYDLGGIKALDRQTNVIDLILTGKVATVEDALLMIDGKSKAIVAKWEAISNGFSRLPEGEQDRFFDLNTASIERWEAKRGRT
jgi:ParB family chromosome partitioning protein